MGAQGRSVLILLYNASSHHITKTFDNICLLHFIPHGWIDAGLLKKEDDSEEIKYDDLDLEVCEEENLIQELTD